MGVLLRVRNIIFLLLLSFPALAAYPVNTALYAEQAYLGRENVMSNSLRVRTGKQITDDLTPYAQGGSELLTSGLDGTTLDPGGSFAYLGSGMRWSLGKVSQYGELRARTFYSPSAATDQRPLDLRGLAVFGDFYQTKPSGLWSGFVEPYSELVYTSGDIDNVILSGFVRGGARLSANQGLMLRFFPRALCERWIRVRHYYNNRADIKPSVRFMVSSSSLNVSVTASYLFNTYFAFGNYEANPYQGRASGPRVLAVVSGQF